MIEAFKKGGKLPKRVVWEIVLGVRDLLEKDRSLVEIEVPAGVKCSVVGDSESANHWPTACTGSDEE